MEQSLFQKLFKNEHTVYFFLEISRMSFFREASNIFNRGSKVKQNFFIFKKPKPVGPRKYVIEKLISIKLYNVQNLPENGLRMLGCMNAFSFRNVFLEYNIPRVFYN